MASFGTGIRLARGCVAIANVVMQKDTGMTTLEAPTAPIPSALSTRKLIVRHRTTYHYDKPVERSKHRLHARPITDRRQLLESFELSVSPAVAVMEFEDVFGNMTSAFEIFEPYTELTVEATSRVTLLDTDPFAFANVPIRPQFPIVWMPWEQKMLTPYLQSQELPDTQLAELYDYAMSFVKANNGDLMETLFNINLMLFREYQYVPGSTTVATTPFEVFLNKKGVCQDFANLFITMARLLGLPARYVCGYLHTGNTGESRAAADASHAWVQLYIPQVGWKGFDPTNGVLPATGHVRVAVGRNYRDTTPMKGTLYTAANEMMTVDVEVRDEG
jgi:transglutaminase-like putative cysteine protease